MTTYICVARDGSNHMLSAYTQSDAFQQATSWAEKHGGLLSMDAQ